MLNPHDDGICLDTFVDWLIEAGHPITRVENYQDWFTRFETAIRALPERQKQHSLLPLLHAFAQPALAKRDTELSAARFRAAVRAAKVGPDHDVPQLRPALIRKYSTELRTLQLISIRLSGRLSA